MRCGTRLLVLALALLLAITPVVGQAQDDTDNAGDNAPAVALLPAAEAFGDGWALLSTDFPAQRHEAFRAATVATYGGPSGARIVLDAMLVADGATAGAAAWERMDAYLQWYEANMLPGADPRRDQELAAMSPPAGCSDAFRIEGRDRIGSFAFPVGVTFCAASPEIIFVVAVSGELDGLTGVAASDAALAMLFSRA